MSEKKALGYDWEFGHEELVVKVSSYAYGGGLHIGLFEAKNGKQFSDLTVNLRYNQTEVNEAYIDDFDSKNKLAFIKKHKLGKVLPEQGYSGYCTYYKVAFDLNRLEELDPNGMKKYRKIHDPKEQELKPKKRRSVQER